MLPNLTVEAQIPNGTDTLYGMEWIVAGQQYARLGVAADDWYDVPYDALAALGWPVDAVASGNYHLYLRGAAVPYHSSRSVGEPLQAGDYLRFYGRKNRGELDRHLYRDSENTQLNPEHSLYADTAYYYLTWTDTPGLTYANLPNDLANAPAAQPYVWRTAEQVNTGSYMKEYYRFSGATLHYSHFGIGEGYGNRTINQLLADGSTTQNVVLPLPQAYTAGPPATLDTRYVAALFEHDQTLTANGVFVRRDSFYNWKMLHVQTPLPPDVLTAGQADIRWEGTADPKDEVSVGYVRVRYPARPDAAGAATLRCELDAGGDTYLDIENFNATAAVVYDLANGYCIVVDAIVGNRLQVRLPAAERTRVLHIVPATATGRATAPIPVDLTLPALGDADYILLTHSLLRTDGDPVQEYADYRATPQGGGYRTAVVNVDNLYDLFGYGVQQHPIAIRNFVAWQRRENPAFQYLFIVGKGREYISLRTPAQLGAALGTTLFVPSFGYPASDNLLVSRIDKPTPLVSIGRLPAITPAEVRLYLNKIRDMETAVANAPQTIAGKAWMKNILHLGGGGTPGEQQSIRSNLESMGAQAESGTFGAQVTGFYKTSTDPIQQSQSDGIFNRINEGVSMLTFFGHSSAGSFDFNIDNPDNYHNVNKYPLMLSLGCYSGNMFDAFRSIGERFLFLEDGGAGVYGASRGLGFVHSLSNFGRYFYERMSNDLYGAPVGDGIRVTIGHYENFTDQAYGTLNEQFSLHGDPGVRLHPFGGADYLVDAPSVGFSPQVISTQRDSFTVQFDVVNLGRGIADSIDVLISHYLPTGALGQRQRVRVPSPGYRGRVSATLSVPGRIAVGINRLEVMVDPDNAIAEQPTAAAEANNQLVQSNGQVGIPFFIVDNSVTPVWPPAFALVGNRDLVLKASTANALAEETTYFMQLDTTPDFAAPLLTHAQAQRGGVVRWQPNYNWQDSVVYYWRIAPDSTTTNNQVLWEGSSFTFIADVYPGWGQGHWGQWELGGFDDMLLDEDRRFAFGSSGFNTRIRNKLWEADNSPGLFYNSDNAAGSVRPWNFINQGIAVVVYPPNNPTGFWRNPPAPNTFSAGDYGVPTGGSRVFAFPTETSTQRANLMTFLNDVVPEDAYVFLFSVLRGSSPNLFESTWAADSLTYGENIFQLIENQGGTQIRQLETLGSVPYIIFYQKGIGIIEEEIAPDFNSEINVSAFIPTALSTGFYSSPIIGPSVAWTSLNWQFLDTTTLDRSLVTLYTGDDANTLDSLTTFEADLSGTFPLNNPDWSLGKYLQLRWSATDSVNSTSPQLVYWHVTRAEQLELAIDPAFHWQISADTLQQGEAYDIEVGISNIGSVPLLDSVALHFTWLNKGQIHQLDTFAIAPLPANESVIWKTKLLTAATPNDNQLLLDLNPNDTPKEITRVNNTLNKVFFTEGDEIAPVVEVTFDGNKILDGDLVAGNTEVSVRISDENVYLPLDDPNLFTVRLIHPDGQDVGINPSTASFQYSFQADANTATLRFQPELPIDGLYRLQLTGSDASGNLSGRLLYEISFEVILEQRLSHFLPYPNPFTTQTQFVYTLTGSDTDVDAYIQIMTVSGRVVKHIDGTELGPLSVGTHRTEYIWDGTDDYGDRLANGVYLYRVVARNSSTQAPIKHFEGSQDSFFSNGIGKIVLLR